MPHQVLSPRFERRDDRGVFREILSGFPAGTVVCGRMNAGAVMGNHYHRRTRVFFYLFAGEADVTNTGANAWLPSDARFGPVLLGVHLLTRDGATIDRDFSRVWLPHGIAPGQSARFRFTMPAPPPGDYRLAFDLVSEQVCWFEMNGSEVVTADVTVSRADR